MLVGYHRIFRAPADFYEIMMLLIEGATIGGGVGLLSYQRDESDAIVPAPLAARFDADT